MNCNVCVKCNQGTFVCPQVILVQVNPGEAFTIRREDGQFQCITGESPVLLLQLVGISIVQF